jgi:hypothetical protein
VKVLVKVLTPGKNLHRDFEANGEGGERGEGFWRDKGPSFNVEQFAGPDQDVAPFIPTNLHIIHNLHTQARGHAVKVL